jgi:hypothetical protein
LPAAGRLTLAVRGPRARLTARLTNHACPREYPPPPSRSRPAESRGASLRLLSLVRSMPTDEAALLAGVGQRLQPTLKRLEQRAAVQKDP